MARFLHVVKAMCFFSFISTLLYTALLVGHYSKNDVPHAHQNRTLPPPNRQADSTEIYGYSLTLTVRMAAISKLIPLLYCTLLRSASIFWSPKLGPISVILDKESERDHRFALKLRQQEKELGFKFDFLYEPLPDTASGWIPKTGALHQRWGSFFMDVSVNTSIIAWTDTDGVFTTPVTPENIFNGRRLRVVAFTDLKRMHRLGWYKSTQQAIGKVMVSSFMTYFPTYVWRDTFTNCRNHIMKHMNVSNFEDAFRRLGPTSPVTVVLNYAYYFEHDRYDWHLDFKESLTSWNAKLPGGIIKPSEIKPDVHVTIHEKYYHKKPHPLLQGYCVARRYVNSTLPTSCLKFQNVTNFQLFEFEVSESQSITAHLDPGAWCSGNGRIECIQCIKAHYRNVKKYYNLGWYDLDLRRLRAVENVARQEMNITCPKIFE